MLVLPYLKVRVPDDDPGPAATLSEEHSPILEPFIGDLLVAYVRDVGTAFELATHGELRDAGMTAEELRRRALANLSDKISETGVRLAPAGKYTAVLFDGNFEATLMLWDDMFPHLHEKHGATLLAVAPARDVFAVAAPEHEAELLAVCARVQSRVDHLLSSDVYRRENERWSVHRSAKGPI